MNTRKVALNILTKTIGDNSYTNLLLRSELEKVPDIQKGFVNQLVYGVLRNYEFLNAQTKKVIEKSVSLKNRLIIIMAIYEKFYMDSEDYAVTNEYVNLADNKYDKGFINACIRNINELDYDVENYEKANLPKIVYEMLSNQYSEKEFETIVDSFRKIRPIYYHLNHKKCSFEEIKYLNIEIINDDIFTSKLNLINTKEFEEGYFYIQDVNANELVKHLDLKENDSFLDACSAPGSKLFNALDYIKDENAYCNDLHEHRVELIKKEAIKLGYKKVNFMCLDAREIKNKLNLKFDKILLDVPCSGLGIIGRRPDIKFHISSNSFDELQALQYEILVSMIPLLNDNGIIVYSTCTLNKKENSKQIEKFLNNNKDFILLEEETLIKEYGDCFYFAKLKRV